MKRNIQLSALLAAYCAALYGVPYVLAHVSAGGFAIAVAFGLAAVIFAVTFVAALFFLAFIVERLS